MSDDELRPESNRCGELSEAPFADVARHPDGPLIEASLARVVGEECRPDLRARIELRFRYADAQGDVSRDGIGEMATFLAASPIEVASVGALDAFAEGGEASVVLCGDDDESVRSFFFQFLDDAGHASNPFCTDGIYDGVDEPGQGV